LNPKEQTQFYAKGSIWEVWKTAFQLGMTSFGGPVAHLGYFHEEYVKRRKWLDEKNTQN
jgi:chromate transporter